MADKICAEQPYKPMRFYRKLQKTAFVLLDFFRVRDWLHVLGLSFLGFVYAYASQSSLFPGLLLSFIASALYIAHGYSLNETIDAAIAAKHSGCEFKDKKGMSFKAALILSYSPFLINLIFSALFLKNILPLIIAGALLAYIYSVAPFRFKGVPFMDLIVNSAGFSVLFLIGYCSLKPLDKNSLLIAVLFFFLFIPLQLIHEIAHLEKDKSESAVTTVVRCGVSRSLKIFFLSLLPFMIWPLYLWRLQILSIHAFLLSILFSAYIFLRFSKILKKYADINMNSLRIHARFLTILYGLCMLFILSKLK